MLRGAETDVAASDELRNALLGGRAARVTIRNYRKDGTAFWNDLSVTPLFDAAARLTHFVAIQSDVTEQAQLAASRHLDDLAAERTKMLEGVLGRLEERRRHVETILNGMLAGLIAAGPDRRVTFANRAALRTLGLSSADFLGRQLVEVFGHSEELASILESGSAGEARLDFPLISQGGVRLYVGMSVWRAPEELRDEIGFLVLFRDLAETLDREAFDSLGILADPDSEGARPVWAEAGSGAAEPASSETPLVDGAPGPEALPAVDEAADQAQPPEDAPLPHRHPGAPAPHPAFDLVRAALARLVDANEGPFRPVQAEADLPAVLVDREQILEALVRLVSNAALRAGDAYRLRIRLGVTSAIGERGTREEQFVRIDILFPREAITEEDMVPDTETETRRQHRRLDVVMGEQLVLANGGRLVRSPEDRSEKGLAILLPMAPPT
jgi:PAS domain S-box-containing protein